MMYSRNHQVLTFEYKCSSTSYCSESSIVLNPGKYLLEAFGASGGSAPGNKSSYGGYSRGILNLDRSVTAFVFIGAQGSYIDTGGGNTETAFNGGGSGRKHSSHVFTGSGGGSSDVRLNSMDLSDRVLVAGGGGGTGMNLILSVGGNGGGDEGGNGSGGFNDGSYFDGGIGGGQNDSLSVFFGYGENFSHDTRNACGGGGGWFGGRAGYGAGAGGGGGSGFVFNKNNTLSTLSYDLTLTEAFTIGGNETFGNLGNGKVKITNLNGTIMSCGFHLYHSSAFLYYVLIVVIITSLHDFAYILRSH